MKFDKFVYMLAPLERITDPAFRTLCFRHGADVTFTEMARVSAILRGNESTLPRVELKNDTPTVIQLLVSKEEELGKFLTSFEPKKGFEGFNLNMGCPSPDMIRAGLGCALVKRVTRANALVKLIKDRGFEASIKMRLGLNEYEKQAKAYMNLIKAVDADYFIVHGRHGKETYRQLCDFSVFKECAKTGKTIVANGDIKRKEDIEFLKEAGVKGAMIGRAAVKDPAIFGRLKGEQVPDAQKLKEEYALLAGELGVEEKNRNIVLSMIGKEAGFDVDRL